MLSHIFFVSLQKNYCQMMNDIELVFKESDYPVQVPNQGKLYAVRKSTNVVIGSLIIYPYKDGVYLSSFDIYDSRNRNKGIGRAMLRYIKEMCRGEKIYLSCAHNNDNALHLYKSEGFDIFSDKNWFDMVCYNR